MQKQGVSARVGKYVEDLGGSPILGGQQAIEFKSEQPRLRALTVIQQKVTRKWSENLLDIQTVKFRGKEAHLQNKSSPMLLLHMPLLCSCLPSFPVLSPNLPQFVCHTSCLLESYHLSTALLIISLLSSH